MLHVCQHCLQQGGVNEFCTDSLTWLVLAGPSSECKEEQDKQYGCVGLPVLSTLDHGKVPWSNRSFHKKHSTHIVLDCLPAGGLAGAIAWWSVYPLDVIKSRIQASSRAESEYKGKHPDLST